MLKKSVLLLVAIIIFMGTFCVFASAEAADIITEYIFAGEAEEGYTTAWESDGSDDFAQDVYLYYTLDVDEDGYYAIGYSNEMASVWVGITAQDNYDEIAYEMNVTDLNVIQKIYYLPKGAYNVLIDMYYADVSVGFFVHILGSEITDISFKHELIDNIDFCYSDEYNSHGFCVYDDAVITFSSGKEFEWQGGKEFYSNSNALCGIADKIYIYGKGDVDILFLGERIETEITVYPTSYYIREVSLSNADYYIETLKKSEIPVFSQGETLTVTFTDGTKQTVECSPYPVPIKMPNDKEYDVRIIFEYVGTEDAEINIYLERCSIKTFESQSSFFERVIDFLKDILALILSFFM